MKSEQLFQIDRQINQIRKSLEQRQERVAEWDVPVDHILKERKNKNYYLSKKYPYLQKDKQNSAYKDTDSYPQQLKNHVEKSRLKIKFYKNDLKELQELVKKRNVIRIFKSCHKSSHVNFSHDDPNNSHLISKEYSKTNYESMRSHELARKTDKQHNTLSTIKGQKILELYQESKAKFGNSESIIGNLKRQLGIGLENTPFYSWLKDKSRTDNFLKKNKQKFSQSICKQNAHYDLYDSIKKQMGAKKKIYMNLKNEEGSKFEQRLKNIIRYHQQNIDCLVSQT